MFVLALAYPHCTGRYRGQLAHEAMVTGLRHVLFVVADSSRTPILYMALVEFPDAAIDAYKRSLLKWTPLFAWMHDPQVRAPTKVPRELVEAVKSHLMLARALRQHIANARQPLLPLRTIKGAPLVAYSVTKSGVDGATSWGDLFRSPRIKLSWGQSMVTDVFQLLCVSSCSSARTAEIFNPRHWPGLDAFRDKCSRGPAFADRAIRVAAELLRDAFQLRSEAINDAAARAALRRASAPGGHDDGASGNEEGDEDSDPPKDLPKRRRAQLWQSRADLMRWRLNTKQPHKTVNVEGVRLKCVVCTKLTSFQCSSCDVALCSKVRDDLMACMSVWHTKQSFPFTLKGGGGDGDGGRGGGDGGRGGNGGGGGAGGRGSGGNEHGGRSEGDRGGVGGDDSESDSGDDSMDAL